MTGETVQFVTLRRDNIFQLMRNAVFVFLFALVGAAFWFLDLPSWLLGGVVAYLLYTYFSPLFIRPNEVVARLQVSDDALIVEDVARRKLHGGPSILPTSEIEKVRLDNGAIWLDMKHGETEYISIAPRHFEAAMAAISARVPAKDAAS